MKPEYYIYHGWTIEYTGRYWVDVDDKSYVFNDIDEAYDFIDNIQARSSAD